MRRVLHLVVKDLKRKQREPVGLAVLLAFPLVFAGMLARYFPGRASGRDYTEATDAHLDATATVEVRIEAASAKARRGGPRGPHDVRPEAPGTAGIQPFPTTSL